MDIKITAMPLDAQRCRFTVDRPVVVAGGMFQFQSPEKAKEHPLAEEIFDLAGVSAVQLSGNQITVAMATPTAWRDAGKEIGRIIREYLISETAHFEQVLAGVSGSRAEQIRLKVQRVLDMQINPSVSSHGGQITLLDVKDNDVYIKMGGGCQGCGMASVTLKSGVEKAIRQYVPEVREIFDTTDHASGKNPYHSPSK